MTQEWILPLRIEISLGSPLMRPANAPPAASQHPAATDKASGPEKRVEEAENPIWRLFDTASLSSSFEFTWRRALSLALASNLAYESEATIKAITANWGMKSCSFFDVDETQCFLCCDNKVVLVAFRGSEAKLGDWLGNLNTLSTARAYGDVHRGFLNGFQAVQGRLEGFIANYTNLPIVITGHSLGGALAVIAAAEWVEKRKGRAAVTSIYTFGQPGVGFDGLSELMDINYSNGYYRFVNDMDIVTMLPPLYKHCGRLVRFGSDDTVENVGSSEREAVGLIDGFTSMDTDMLNQAEFDYFRAQILYRRAEQLQRTRMNERTGTSASPVREMNDQTSRTVPPLPLHEIENAVATTFGQQNVEGWLPSIQDHFMANYIKAIATQAKV